MKNNLTKLTFLFLLFVASSFTSNHKTTTRYAVVTAFEENNVPGESKYMVTNVVSFNCDLSDLAVEVQFQEYYNGEIKSGDYSLSYSSVAVWNYNSHDAALAGRRELLADSQFENKRQLGSFYVTCE